MKKIYNLVRARRLDAEGSKTFWDRVGVLVIDEDRISARMDSIPVGNWDGWLMAFPRNEQDEDPPSTKKKSNARAFDQIDENDMPF